MPLFLPNKKGAFHMEEQKKSRKPLLVGVIAAVVVLAALLALLLTQCVGGTGPSDTSGTETTAPAVQGYQLYWNVDRNNFEVEVEGESTTGRKPADDGFYHMVFAVDGKQVELRVKERRLVNIIDAFDIMGLVFDENGDVIDIIRLDDMPIQKIAWQYYIQSFGGNAIKLNSSKDMNGMEEMIKTNDQTVIYDVSGWSEFVGAPGKLQKNDRAYVIANEAGEITHIFLYERDGIERTVRAECKHCGEEVTWHNWLKNDVLPTTTGHYFLENNVHTKVQNAIQDDAKVCLDLNGYQVYSNSTARIYSTFYAGSGLAVMDNSEEKKGIFIVEGQNMDQAGGLWARYGNIDIYDITIDASGATSHAGGTAVGVESTSTMILHSGKLIGGKLVTVKGKGNLQAGATVLVNGNGKFIMESGTIVGGETPRMGGAVAVIGKGTFTMNSGKIMNGRTKGVNGGNIYIANKDCTFNMYGGSITGGRAYKSDKNANGAGGNVVCYGVFNMYGGTISGGRAYNYDGTLDDTDLRQNFFLVNGKLYMYGGKIAGSMHAIDTNLKDTDPCLVYVSNSAKITGAPEGKTNLTLNKGVKFQAGKLSGKAEIYVKASGVFSDKTRESNVNYVHSDDPTVNVVYYDGCLAMGRVQCICGASLTEGKAHVGICDGTLQFFGPYINGSIDSKSSGNYYLTKDYDKVGQLSFGSATTKDADGKTVYPDPITINLDLNGHTINSLNRSILALSMTTVNITDSVGGGKITGRGVTLPYTNAGVLLIQQYATINILGDLTLDGRDDMHETMNSGGVAQVNGILNMYAGTLDGGPVGGSTDAKGVVQKGMAGAVQISSGGIVNMYGDAKITNGVTKGDSAHGGNVYIMRNGQLNMFDNSIIENGAASVDNKGGGGNVYVAAGGAMSMQDNAQIINGKSDPKTQPRSKDVFCVNGKLYMNGGHIGTMALTNWNANDCEMVVANNASVDSLGMGFGNDKGKTGATKTADIQIVGVLADDAKIVLNAPKVGYFTTETVAENADNFAASDNQKIFFNARYKKLSVGDVADPLYHCVCGMQYAESLDGTVTSKGTCFGACDGEIHEWQPWTGSTMPNKGGYWIMSEGTYSTANVKTAEEIYVDLNGKTVSVKEKNRAWLFEGSLDGHEVKLVITDFAGGGTVKSLEAAGDHSILIWGYRPSYDLDKDEKATKETPTYLTVGFDLYGGHLDASAYTCQGTYGTNGAIEVGKDAKINLYGGKISGANVVGKSTEDKDTKEVTKLEGRGGAFTLATGTVMNMSGNAEIVGGSVPQSGGAIYMNGGATLIMSGNSKITGGKVTGAPQGDTHGGSLYMASKAVLVMNDNASISGGSAMNAYTYVDKDTDATRHRSAQGGNIYANGSITLNGNASITGGACDTYALTEPDAKAYNADIFLVGANASLTMNGGSIGYITVAANAGKISLSGAPVVESFKLNNGWVMDITGTLDDAADITLLNPALGLFTGETVAENADNFKTTNNIPVTYSRKDKKLNVGVISEPTYHCVCGMKSADSLNGTVTSKGTCFGECTGEIKEWEPWTGTTLPDKNGYWFLTTDDTSYANAVVGEWSGTKGTTSDPSYEIYVDLNGKTSYINAKARAYSFGKANVVELTITDSVGGGQIINKEAPSVDHAVMFWNRTTLKPVLNIYGGTMDSSKAVNANASYGGQGAVYLGANAEINMFGGTVIGMDVISNKSSGTLKYVGSGGAFYLSSGTVMTVTGGEIIGSHVSENGGAIYAPANSTLLIANATVTGGEAAQGAAIYSAGSVTIINSTINGGVAQRDTVNNKGGRGAALFVNSGNLVLDNTVVNGGYASALSGTDAGEAYGGNALFINNGTVEAIKGTKLNGYTAEHSNVRRGGTVYMLNGSFTLNNSTISGSKVQVNGAAVQMSNGTFTMTGENAAITMADVGTKTYGGAVTIAGGTFNLEDGVINGTEVTYTTGGGAVAVYGNSQFEMTGGKITGGSATQNNGGGVCLTSGTMSISGDAQITGNTGGNLYVSKDAKIEVGTMTTTANVGITLESGTGVFSSNTVAATTGFVSDNTAYEVVLVGEKLAIQDPNNPLPDSGEPSDTTTDSSEPSDTTPPAQGDSVFHCLCGKKTAESLTGTVTSKGDCLEGCDGTIHEWTKWEDTTKLPNTNGYYYLADNVTTSATTNIGEAKSFDEATAAASMNVAIDLNGKTVTSSAVRVFVLGNSLNTTLTITDTVGTGVIYTRDCTNGTTSVDQGAFLWNHATKVSTVNIFGGTIDASKSDTNLKTPYGGQGAIDIGTQTGTTGHVLNIAGGTIKGQNISKNFKVNNDMTVTTTAWTGNGGAIYVRGTTVTISGDAKIYGGDISGNGGAIYVGKNASLTLKDNAQVIGGHAMSGGNIYVENSFTMDGGLVTQGTAGTAQSTKHGGGVYGTSASTITINGGKITENTATIGGGGIYTNGNLIITGGEVTGNTAASTQPANFDIYGVGAEVTMSGGKVGIMTVSAYQTDASMTISGAPVIENLTLNKADKAASGTSPAITPDFPAIKLAEGKTLAKGTSIGLNINTSLRNNNLVFTEANAAFKDYEDYFRSADGTYTAKFHTDGEYANKLQLVANYYCLCATKTGEHMEGCDGTKHEWKAWDLSSKTTLPNTTGYWYLTGTPSANLGEANIGNLSNAAVKLEQTATYDVAVDLRGKQITMKANNRIWVFGESASTKLSITDSIGGATVTHAAKDGADQALIMWNRFCNDATVNFFGGTFDPRAGVTNANSQYGGQGAMEMLEGDTINITGNTVIYGQEVTKGTSGKGGVLKIDARDEWAETSTLKISGNAKVYGSTVSAFGGAICAETSIAITMKDNAELIGGTAAIRGGAIYMSAGGSLTMSDNAKIRDGKVVSTLTTLAASGNTANAPWGGNIYSGGTATITMSDNATISGGVVDAKSGNNHGGNIYMNGANQTLVMSGNAKITGGNAMNGQGGNMYTNGTITMSGNAEITGGMLNTNATADNADVFAVDGNLNMSGNTKVGYFVAYNTEPAGTNVVKLEGEPVITLLSFAGGAGTNADVFTKVTIVGTLGNNASIGVNMAVAIPKNVYEFTTATVAENADNFTSSQGNVVFMSDTSVLRVATPDMYCLCAASKTGAAHKNGCNGEIIKWTKWEKTNSLPNTDGYYYLSDNVTAGTTCIGTFGLYDANSNDTRNIAIDLNGKTVTVTDGRAFVLGTLKTATFTITDSVGTGVINTRDCTSGNTSVDQGSIMWNRGTGTATVNIFGGTLDASKSDTNLLSQYGGVGAIDVGTEPAIKGAPGGHVLNIAGGIIKGQNITKNVVVNADKSVTTTAWSGHGGAIFIQDGTVTISGDAQVYGGNVSGNGGAIYIKNSTLNMIGGTVYGGNAINGGAIYLAGGSQMTMSGNAEIVGGAVAVNAGSVFMEANTTLTMSDNAKISGGSTTGTSSGDTHGGNVLVSGDAMLTMSGNAQITGGSAMNSFENRVAYGGNIYILTDGTLNISGNASISGGACMTGATDTAPVATDSRADIFNVNGTITMDGGYIGRLCCATPAPGTVNVGGKAEILRLQTPNAVKITKALETGASITTSKGVGTKVAESGTWSATELTSFAAFFHGTSNTVGVAEADGIYLRAQ